MICHTMAAQVGAIEQVVQAVKSGELSQKSIQASVDRVSFNSFDTRLKILFLSYINAHKLLRHLLVPLIATMDHVLKQYANTLCLD